VCSYSTRKPILLASPPFERVSSACRPLSLSLSLSFSLSHGEGAAEIHYL
jgi:hypothetical protein